MTAVARPPEPIFQSIVSPSLNGLESSMRVITADSIFKNELSLNWQFCVQHADEIRSDMVKVNLRSYE